MTRGRCADLSEAAGEAISATATTAGSWLLLEVPGAWPRDVADAAALDARSGATVAAWLDDVPGSRLVFVRRPNRACGERRLAFVVRATEDEAEVRRLELDDDDGLAGVDLATGGTVVDRQLVLVCGHGTRDACCALRGRAVLDALASHVAPDDLWLSSHQGGHRFAANVLVLPAGIQLGRISPGDAVSVVSDALAGTISLEHYRGRTAYTRREQAAERVLRESLGLVRTSELTLVGDDGVAVQFVDEKGREHRAVPEEQVGPAVPASCGVDPEPQPHVTARIA